MSLFKGFIRSAVNQVGRDSGRVISNSIFGNAHATPVRNANNNSANINNEEIITPNDLDKYNEEQRLYAITNGYKLTSVRTDTIQVIGIFLLGFIPLFLGALFFICAAIRRIYYFCFGNTHFRKRALIANKIPDRRYSCGYRIDGVKKGWEIIEVPPTIGERFMHIKRALLYLIIGVCLAYVNYMTIQYIDRNIENDTIETIISKE